MATTYNDTQIAIVDGSGNVNVIYPITKASLVSLTATSYSDVESCLAALGAAAFSNSYNDLDNKPTVTYVRQIHSSDNNDYNVLFSYSTATSSEKTEQVKKNYGFKYNPYTGNLQTAKLNGGTIGSSPKFTDTTTGTTYVADSVPANTTFATNGSVKNVYDDAKAFALYIGRRARSNITNDLDNLLTAISEQNLERYGYKIGDYFRTQRYTYILGDYNTFYGTYQGDSKGTWINTNHLCIVALDDTGITRYWHNTNDLTNVGYLNSTIRLNLITGTLLNNIKADMKTLFGGTTGLEHILPVRRLLSAGLNGSTWVSDEYISLLSENQVVGAPIYSANPHQSGEAINQLEVFRKYNFPELFDFDANGYYWLRNMQSASEVCVMSSAGDIWHIPPSTKSYKVAVCFNLY